MRTRHLLTASILAALSIHHVNSADTGLMDTSGQVLFDARAAGQNEHTRHKAQNTPPAPDDEVDVLLILKSKPVDSVVSNAKLSPEGKAESAAQAAELAQKQRKIVHGEQIRVIKSLRAGLPHLKVRSQIDTLLNAVAVTVRYRDIQKLSMHGRVERDYIVRATQELRGSAKRQLRPSRQQKVLQPTGSGQIIAIIDSGVDYTHTDLGGCLGPACKVIGGYDFVANDSDPMDEHKHGTHVAGIAAGNGGVRGVAPDAKILAIRVLDKRGFGHASTIIKGIEFALDPDGNPATNDGAHIANISIGGPGTPDDALAQAVNTASARGLLVVASAGNSGMPMRIGSPGVADTALTVGAVDAAGELAYFSSQGPVEGGKTGIKPDLVAPGVNIRSSVPGGQYESQSGTSMAAPYVSGAAALLRELYPHLTPAALKANLLANARRDGAPIAHKGAGHVDIHAALNAPIELNFGELHPGWSDPKADALSFEKTLILRNRLDRQVTVGVSTAHQGLPLPVADKKTLSLPPKGSEHLHLAITQPYSAYPFAEGPGSIPYNSVILTAESAKLQLDSAPIHTRELVLDSSAYGPDAAFHFFIGDQRWGRRATIHNNSEWDPTKSSIRLFDEQKMSVQIIEEAGTTSFATHPLDTASRSISYLPRPGTNPVKLKFELKTQNGLDFRPAVTSDLSPLLLRGVSLMLDGYYLYGANPYHPMTEIHLPSENVERLKISFSRRDSNEYIAEIVPIFFKHGPSESMTISTTASDYKGVAVKIPKRENIYSNDLILEAGFLSESYPEMFGGQYQAKHDGATWSIYIADKYAKPESGERKRFAFRFESIGEMDYSGHGRSPFLSWEGNVLHRITSPFSAGLDMKMEAINSNGVVDIEPSIPTLKLYPKNGLLQCIRKDMSATTFSQNGASLTANLRLQIYPTASAPYQISKSQVYSNTPTGFCWDIDITSQDGRTFSTGKIVAMSDKYATDGFLTQVKTEWGIVSDSPPILFTLDGIHRNKIASRLTTGSAVQGSFLDAVLPESVQLSIKRRDETEWQAIAVAVDGKSFHAKLPELNPGPYDLSVSAADKLGNTLDYFVGSAFEWLPSLSDADDDGHIDTEDAFPHDPMEWRDSDQDGVGNKRDGDDDNDGIDDIIDLYPLDATEAADSDRDGVGDNADTDDDNDGVTDAQDAFPLDRAESIDTDKDGIGNNADSDDDNDGVADTQDTFPLDATRWRVEPSTPPPSNGGGGGGGSGGLILLIGLLAMLAAQRHARCH